jgi:hypothetical protein
MAGLRWFERGESVAGSSPIRQLEFHPSGGQFLPEKRGVERLEFGVLAQRETRKKPGRMATQKGKREQHGNGKN